MAIYLGDGATFTFGDFNGHIISISGLSVSRERIQDIQLGSTGFINYVFSTLLDHQPLELTLAIQGDELGEMLSAITDETPDTGTLTYQKRTGETTAAVISGTGLATQVQFGDHSSGERVEGSLQWSFDGVTGPTITEFA